MDVNTDTARRLAEMNDAAAFEHIAAAVLRAANPQIYGNLSHPGVKPGGKTVKAAFDNVGWLQLAEGPRFVCAAHTTEQKDLEGKWLHDPATVKPKKPGGKPTKPAGDLVKGITEVQKLRETHSGLGVTFALTTNSETSLKLRVSVESLAKSAGIDLDVWSVSRIAHFLDTDPTGQIIRRNHLGTPVKLLSRRLLLQIGRRSLEDYLLLGSTGKSIRRENFHLGRTDTLVVGASGMGKTTSCGSTLDLYLTKGLPAIVLRTEFLVGTASIEAALEGELLRQEPALESGAGGKALSLCTEEEPLLILVEDVNRADSPELLLNRVLLWTRAVNRRWRVICPIWPQHLDLVEDKKRALAKVDVIHVNRYTAGEAIKAISNRAQQLDVSVDEYHAKTVADQLGYDPFLIGIYDLKSIETPTDVIQLYVEERLKIVANRAHRTMSEMVLALHELLRCMLQHGTLSPRWNDVTSWIADKDIISLIRHISHEGNVLHIHETGNQGVLGFRHDRLMYWLLSGALAEVLNAEEQPHYVTDPFFSEVVASAIVRIKLPASKLETLLDKTPVTAAHALRLTSELDSNYARTAVEALNQWLYRHSNDVNFNSRRYAIARTLAETSSPYVPALIGMFHQNDHFWPPLLAAAFRNGNFNAGFSLMEMFNIGIAVAGRQHLLNTVLNIYGNNLVSAIEEELRRADDCFFSNKLGALRLAGYLGCSSLAEAIQECWKRDSSEYIGEELLSSYIFAAARCCGDKQETILGPICDAWEALPEEHDPVIGQPVERVAADHVAWAFRTYTPSDAIHYFVSRSKYSDKIRWPIAYMLRTVDHPDAVDYLARYSAENSNFMVYEALKSDWERRAREKGKSMSSESKKRLISIARNEDENERVRCKAFSFWSLSIDDSDLKIACEFSKESPLYDQALWVRARLKDQSVISDFVKKISEAPEHWLHIERYLWSEALTDTLPPLLDKLAQDQASFTNLEYSLAEALCNVDHRKLLEMLEPRWAKLKSKPKLVQILLFLNNSSAERLLLDAFSASPHPSELLKHLTFNYLEKSNKINEVDNPKQLLKNLKPYLKYLSKNDLTDLRNQCIKRGLTDFCFQYIEPKMLTAADFYVRSMDMSVDTKCLDQALLNEPGVRVNLYHWLSRQSEHGTARDRLFEALLCWLKRHPEERALFIVGEIISNEATRQEFNLFEKLVIERVAYSEYLNAIRFDVFSRTLI
ncbi:Uncharacterised protein [Serratia fonticola]|uniref:hypothetical protein n=1 Tax=Serratia fonticola TaxID=47917 RepID=UPI0021781ADB|nr:hypothetical protein [Serratia fonticola]CAI1946321.1 Uncharacterised protein [Serratia fonticola]